LRLNYTKHLYGPYADNLNHVLQSMEGHFIRGYLPIFELGINPIFFTHSRITVITANISK
jgi:hypothetical protein